MEIERKFLTEKVPFDMDGYEKLEIKQGYISVSPTIRVRKSDEKYYLTIKKGGGLLREEFEIEISERQFERLWKKVETNAVEKTRYLIPLDCGLIAEVDLYKGVLSGLITTEVEFPNTDDAKSFEPPEWFGKDVTDDKRYSNSSLSISGLIAH